MAKYRIECLRPGCGSEVNSDSLAEIVDWNNAHDEVCTGEDPAEQEAEG